MDLQHLLCFLVAVAQSVNGPRRFAPRRATVAPPDAAHSRCEEEKVWSIAALQKLSGAPATFRHIFASQWEACLMGGHHAFVIRSSRPDAQTLSQMFCAPQPCSAPLLKEMLVHSTMNAGIEVAEVGCWGEGHSPEQCCASGPECWADHPLGPHSGFAFTGLLSRVVEVCCEDALRSLPYEVLLGFFDSVAYSLPGRLYTTTSMTVHVATLRVLASHGSSVIELGVQFGDSSWGLLTGLVESHAGRQKRRMVSVDVEPSIVSSTVRSVALANNVSYTFLQASSLHVKLRPAELVFIDDLHAYAQVRAELAIYAPLALQYIVLHDTVSWRDRDECNDHRYRDRAICARQPTPGIYRAVEEFLEKHPEWKVRSHTDRSAGLTVLKRQS